MGPGHLGEGKGKAHWTPGRLCARKEGLRRAHTGGLQEEKREETWGCGLAGRRDPVHLGRWLWASWAAEVLRVGTLDRLGAQLSAVTLRRLFPAAVPTVFFLGGVLRVPVPTQPSAAPSNVPPCFFLPIPPHECCVDAGFTRAGGQVIDPLRPRRSPRGERSRPCQSQCQRQCQRPSRAPAPTWPRQRRARNTPVLRQAGGCAGSSAPRQGRVPLRQGHLQGSKLGTWTLRKPPPLAFPGGFASAGQDLPGSLVT